jgi:hypothetical protein
MFSSPFFHHNPSIVKEGVISSGSQEVVGLESLIFQMYKHSYRHSSNVESSNVSCLLPSHSNQS